MDDKLVLFLYLLCRDKLPAGEVEGLVREAMLAGQAKPMFSGPYLEAMARDWAAKLR